MDASKEVHGASVPLESVLCTERLDERVSRPPDYEAESGALGKLGRSVSGRPEEILQALVEVAVDVCRAHSSVVSLLEAGDAPGRPSLAGDRFRWYAVAGHWAEAVGNVVVPKESCPCEAVLDTKTAMLFVDPHRHYGEPLQFDPPFTEGLLVPFTLDGDTVGSIWVVLHDGSQGFDAEDRRLLESIAPVAALGYQEKVRATEEHRKNGELEAEIVRLHRSEEALRVADRRKTEFLAILAHELRNPLAPIHNALQLLRLSPGDVEASRAALDLLERQVRQVVRLVDDLLDVSRISRGKIELRTGRIDLRAVVQQAVEAIGPLCDSMDHELTVATPEEPVHVEGDPARLAQVVGNLLNNACKFTPRGGRVWLELEKEEESAIIRVRDNGIGIDPEHMPHIFEMFTQVGEPNLERSRDGLGIGLTLVKKLVEMHHGSIEAVSTGTGQGTEFVVRLPLHAEQEVPAAGDAGDGKLEARKPRRVLVVDDSRDAVEILGMLLQARGHQVFTAHDGVQALAAAEEVEPDVILLDIGLPGLNGYEVARRIRARSDGKRATLIALTGWGQEEDRRRSEEAGFDVHMVKPVDFTALARLLDEQ